MCTVTFIPTKQGIILTSNRDESPARGTAIKPRSDETNSGDIIIYPTDSDHGGTWIAAKSTGDAAVLFNGAFSPHIRQSSYRESRGVIFLSMFREPDPLDFFRKISLNDIEPFSLVLYQTRRLFVCQWDGSHKHLKENDVTRSYIWSSVTLYNESIQREREEWFARWQKTTPYPGIKEVFRFHHKGGNGDSENDLVINRPGKMKTVSITSIQISDEQRQMIYYDLKDNESQQIEIPVPRARKSLQRSKQIRLSFKRMLTRAGSWEYWPFHLVYVPVYIYWLVLSIKSRSFFFFNTANPGIQNGGFLLEQKKEIYDLLPPGSYPKTIRFTPGSAIDQVQADLDLHHIGFPLIAKPDIGQRGVGVTLLHSTASLAKYLATAKVDFLLQEFVAAENEAGIFYYRLPGEPKGHITGIVGKELLTIQGDGVSTVEELMMRNKRYSLQIPALKKTSSNLLDDIPPKGKIVKPAPYGNHSRGAKFIDQTSMLTEELQQAIDGVCRQIQGFYYGRLDIKFNSWEELREGNNFHIIELNGAGSEPAHIYDPAHSPFFAWKEIIRHIEILHRISMMNAKKENLPFMSTAEGLRLLRNNKRYLKQLSSQENH